MLRHGLILLILTTITEGKQPNRLKQRLETLELKFLTESVHMRNEINNLEDALDRIEERFNESNVEGPSGIDIARIGNEYWMDEKESQINEISDKLRILGKGFSDEKRLNSRLRRHLSVSENTINDLHAAVKEINGGILAVLTKLENKHCDIDDIRNALRKLSEDNDSILQIAENVNHIKGMLQSASEEEDRPRSCLQLLQNGHTSSGIYNVYPQQKLQEIPIKVFCDQETDGGGWTVFQRRKDGSINFNRPWFDYEVGFGDPEGEFWQGNELIHQLMFAKCCYTLRVDLEDFENNKRHAKYSKFSIGQKSEDYVLNVGGYTGDAGDSLTRHNGDPFSAKDYGKSKHCSDLYKGGWWYDNCHKANLNGLYLSGSHTTYANGVNWESWKGYHYSLKFSEMKFRENSEY